MNHIVGMDSWIYMNTPFKILTATAGNIPFARYRQSQDRDMALSQQQSDPGVLEEARCQGAWERLWKYQVFRMVGMEWLKHVKPRWLNHVESPCMSTFVAGGFHNIGYNPNVHPCFCCKKKVFSHPGGEYLDGFSTHLGPSVKSLIGAATWKCERIPWGPTWKLMKRWEPEPRIFWWFDEQQFGCNQQDLLCSADMVMKKWI